MILIVCGTYFLVFVPTTSLTLLQTMACLPPALDIRLVSNLVYGVHGSVNFIMYVSLSRKFYTTNKNVISRRHQRPFHCLRLDVHKIKRVFVFTLAWSLMLGFVAIRFVEQFVQNVDRQIHWLVSCLLAWWLICWFNDWYVGWIIAWLVDLLVHWLVCWFDG